MNNSKLRLTLAAVALSIGTAVFNPGAAAANQSPVAVVNLTVLSVWFCDAGTCAYHYQFDGYQSSDPDGSIASYLWVENGVVVASGPTYLVDAIRAYEGCTGAQRGTLIVTDNQGATASACYGYAPY